MQVVSGEIEYGAAIRHEDRHVPWQSIERHCQFAVRRVVDQHRAHAMARVFQYPCEDQPSLRDEQTLRPQPLGVRHVAKGRDPGIGRASDPFNRHVELTRSPRFSTSQPCHSPAPAVYSARVNHETRGLV